MNLLKLSGVLFSGFLMSSESIASQEVLAAVPSQKVINGFGYNLNTYAEFLGLSIKQYYRLAGALDGSPTAIKSGPGFNLAEHPSALQVKQVLLSGHEIPEELFNEFEGIRAEYIEGLAKYVGVSVSELGRLEKEYYNLVNTLEKLDNSNFRLKGHNQTNAASDDGVERIEVIGTEQKIEETSSGAHTTLTTAIWNFGIGQILTGGVGTTIDVQVVFISTNSSLRGTQTFRVSRSNAFPVSALSCDGEACQLTPQF